jgi:hypothetical protein
VTRCSVCSCSRHCSVHSIGVHPYIWSLGLHSSKYPQHFRIFLSAFVGWFMCDRADQVIVMVAACESWKICLNRTLPNAVEVNSLSSFETELPFDYYSLPFCKPKGGVQKSKSSVNPGNILSGLRMYNSPYVFKAMVRSFRCPLLGFMLQMSEVLS